MTCRRIVDQLPWWINGTLERSEAKSVAAHVEDCAFCLEQLAATHWAMALYALHLPVDTLLNRVEDEAATKHSVGDRTGLSRTAVDAHLGHCAACRQDLAWIRESHAAIANPSSPWLIAADLVSQRAELAGAGTSRRRLDQPSLAIAASLLLFVIAAGGWLATDRTADRRGNQMLELERRLSEAELAAVRSDDGVAAENHQISAALVAAEMEAATLSDQVAALEAQIEEAALVQSAETLTGQVGFGPTIVWDVRVLRSGVTSPADETVRVSSRASEVALFVEIGEEGPLRLLVEDEEGKKLLERDGLATFVSSGLDKHLTVTLPVSEFGGETLRIRLFSGGKEIGSRTLVIEN